MVVDLGLRWLSAGRLEARLQHIVCKVYVPYSSGAALWLVAMRGKYRSAHGMTRCDVQTWDVLPLEKNVLE